MKELIFFLEMDCPYPDPTCFSTPNLKMRLLLWLHPSSNTLAAPIWWRKRGLCYVVWHPSTSFFIFVMTLMTLKMTLKLQF